MLSTLNQLLNLKPAISSPDRNHESKNHEVFAKLYYLLDQLNGEQQLTLLKLLLRDKMKDFLFKLVIDLPDSQREVLMKQLEQITSKTPDDDRRNYSRKDCLINAKISVANQIRNCFILDISPNGAYIDADDGIVVGQSAQLMFLSPNTGERLIISGQFIWNETQGAGLKFNSISQKQLKILRSFTENKEEIYEINSC